MENPNQPTPESETKITSVEEAFAAIKILGDKNDETVHNFQDKGFPQDSPFYELVAIVAKDGDWSSYEELYGEVRDRVDREDFDRKEEIFDFIDALAEISSQTMAIELEWAPKCREVVRGKIDEIVASTDWDKLVDNLLSGSSAVPPSDITELCYFMGRIIRPNYQSIEAMYTDTGELDKLKYLIAQHEFTAEATAPTPENGWLTQGNLVEVLNDWTTSLELSQYYLAPGRRMWLERHVQDARDDTAKLKTLIERIDIRPSDSVPAPLMDVLESRAATVATTFWSEADTAFAALSEKKANALFVSGVQNLNETTGLELLENQEATITWLAERLDRFPKHLVDSLGFVEFVKTDNTPNADGFFETGEYKEKENKITVDVLHGKYLKLLEANSHVASAQETTLEDLTVTLDHEIAHHIHSKVLSLRQIQQWELILGNDPEPISPYAANVRQDWVASDSSSRTPKRARYGFEMFAITLPSYMANPAKLATEKPERFEFFNSLMGLYDETETALHVGVCKKMIARSPNHSNYTYSISNKQLGARP